MYVAYGLYQQICETLENPRTLKSAGTPSASQRKLGKQI